MTTEGIIGNIFESDLLSLWHGDKATAIRAKIASGDFSVCRPEACPLVQNDSIPNISDEELPQITTVTDSPEYINLAYDFLCNQTCETCRKQKFRPLPDYRKKVTEIGRKVLPYINKAGRISMSGHGDPFASPYMMQLLMGIEPQAANPIIEIETNGVYFDKKHWKKISHLSGRIGVFNVTVNSFDPFTYSHISKGGNYKKLMENLAFAAQLHDEGHIGAFLIGMVYQDRNFREIPTFIRRAREEFRCDRVILKPVYQWGTMAEDVFWFKDVLNPMHPYHAEWLEIMADPILREDYVYDFGGGTAHPARPFPGHSKTASGERS
ncbi:MAG: hypothetical protein BCS36_08780 [Desulfovibrio sp. MES5]|nr:MAG: hypothetical protein BCS36_08780 [Desulfovibrio sp. MES5]